MIVKLLYIARKQISTEQDEKKEQKESKQAASSSAAPQGASSLPNKNKRPREEPQPSKSKESPAAKKQKVPNLFQPQPAVALPALSEASSQMVDASSDQTSMQC